MRRILAALALLIALPAWSANVTVTTGWLFEADSTAFNPTVTVDAGSNRKFIIFYIDRDSSNPAAPSCTIDSVAPDETLTFNGGAGDHNHYLMIWDESSLATIGATGTVATCDTGMQNDLRYLYGTIENTDQAALTAYSGTGQNSSDFEIATTSDSGDLIVCGSQDDDETANSYNSWDTLTEIHDGVVDSSLGGFAAGDGTDDTTTIDIATPAANNGAACAVFPDATAVGEFDVNPTVSSQTTAQFVVGGSTDASVTVSAVACAKDSTAPTIAQAVAGDCTGDVNALAAVSETWDGANDFVLGGALPLKIYDLYVTEGTNLVTLADEQLDVVAGYERTILGAQDPTSVYDGTETVAGDYCDTEAVTSPSSYLVTPAADGTIEYAAGADPSRQIILGNCHDLSESDIDEYQFVFNNQSPDYAEGVDSLFEPLYQIGTAPGVDLSLLVVDPELDDIDWTVTAGALPTDWALDSETGLITDGDPGACGSYSFTITLTDTYSATSAVPGTVDIGPLVPNVANVAEATAITTIEALCSLTAVAGTPRSSSTVAEGNVIETDPAADTLVVDDQAVTYFLSTGPGGSKLNLGLGLGL